MEPITPLFYDGNAMRVWGGWRGSNPRPLEPQSSALPAELHPPRGTLLILSGRARRPQLRGGCARGYGSISPERIAYRTMLAVSCTPSFSRMRLRCESAVL